MTLNFWFPCLCLPVLGLQGLKSHPIYDGSQGLVHARIAAPPVWDEEHGVCSNFSGDLVLLAALGVNLEHMDVFFCICYRASFPWISPRRNTNFTWKQRMRPHKVSLSRDRHFGRLGTVGGHCSSSRSCQLIAQHRLHYSILFPHRIWPFGRLFLEKWRQGSFPTPSCLPSIQSLAG